MSNQTLSESTCCLLYTTMDNVKVLLANKVQYQTGKVAIDGQIPDGTIGALIRRAETRTEQDLSGRYKIPFQSCRTARFIDLPDSTKRAIQTAVDLRSVVEILMTDFGRGTHINGDNYYTNSLKEYDGYIDRLLGRNPEAANSKRDRYRFTPPLEDLLLAYQNRYADDGYKGMIINTDASTNNAEAYAEAQINDPSKTYLNRRLGWYP